MIRFLLSILASAVALWLVTYLFPGLMTYEGEPWGLIAVALIIGVVNGLIGPIVRLLALPLTVVTLGLIGFVINAGSCCSSPGSREPLASTSTSVTFRRTSSPAGR